MKTQTSLIDPRTSQKASSKTAKSSLSRLKSAAATKVARREANRTYRWKNAKVLREKARVRMAAHRQAIKDAGSVSEETAARVKQAHAKYREKKRKHLVFKARLRRQEAFISKHGVEAHRAMLEKIRDRENAAWAAKLAEEDEAQRAAHAARQQSATSHTQV